MNLKYLSLVLLVSLVGCGAKSSPDDPKNNGTKVITEVPQKSDKPTTPPKVFTSPSEEAVEKLKGTPTADLIAQLSDEKQRDIAARALAARGTEAVPALLTALGDKEPTARAAAVYALGQCGKNGASALEKLRTLKEKDDSELVRDAAAFAIDAIEGK